MQCDLYGHVKMSSDLLVRKIYNFNLHLLFLRSASFAIGLHSLASDIGLAACALTPINKPPSRRPSSTQLGTTRSRVDCSSSIKSTVSPLSSVRGDKSIRSR
mmetsp:Transcript_12965/g.23384  ORF Transcript_12965/g.23384 Transcript_12965/m.23384 type:complete len:102 (-) Transcript_12965:1908-2213(-)